MIASFPSPSCRGNQPLTMLSTFLGMRTQVYTNRPGASFSGRLLRFWNTLFDVIGTEQPPLVFISHIHEEASLAKALRCELEQMFSGKLKGFIASEADSIPEGSAWLEGVRQGLASASVALILVSSRSKERPWINFEAGAVAFAKPMIPVCHSGLHPTQLPQTLQGWQAVNQSPPRAKAEFISPAHHTSKTWVNSLGSIQTELSAIRSLI